MRHQGALCSNRDYSDKDTQGEWTECWGYCCTPKPVRSYLRDDKNVENRWHADRASLNLARAHRRHSWGISRCQQKSLAALACCTQSQVSRRRKWTVSRLFDHYSASRRWKYFHVHFKGTVSTSNVMHERSEQGR